MLLTSIMQQADWAQGTLVNTIADASGDLVLRLRNMRMRYAS